MPSRASDDRVERRTASIGFQLTPTERAKIERRAKSLGFSLAEYGRRKLLSGHMPATGRDPQAIRDLIAAINNFSKAIERNPRYAEAFPEAIRKELIAKVISG